MFLLEVGVPRISRAGVPRISRPALSGAFLAVSKRSLARKHVKSKGERRDSYLCYLLMLHQLKGVKVLVIGEIVGLP